MPDVITLLGVPVAIDASLALLLGVVFVAGVIRGFMGFGSALLIVPALALVFSPAQAVVIEVLIEIPISLSLFPAVVRVADRKAVGPMLIMCALFVPVGALLLKYLDPEPLKIGISLFVLVMVVVVAFQRRLAAMLTPAGVLATGVVSGVSQGLTGMAGPLFATALLARGEAATQTRANLLATSAGIIALSVVSFLLVGLMTFETVIYALLATPSILAGGIVGAVLFRRLSHVNLRGVILAFLAISAMATLGQAIS